MHGDNSVSLLCLAGALHVLVCETEQLIGRVGRIFGDGISHTAVDGERQVAIYGQLMQFLPYAIDDDFNVLFACVKQEDGELTPAVTRHQIAGARCLDESVGDRTQHIVADGLTKPVVDFFEALYVEHQEEHTRPPSPRAGSEASCDCKSRGKPVMIRRAARQPVGI
jgi:hypothetical protein